DGGSGPFGPLYSSCGLTRYGTGEMKRLVHYPLMAASLVLMWLLLNQSIALGHVLFGIAAALFATWVMARLDVKPSRIRFSSAIPRLAGSVLKDIVRSNIAVARI